MATQANEQQEDAARAKAGLAAVPPEGGVEKLQKFDEDQAGSHGAWLDESQQAEAHGKKH